MGSNHDKLALLREARLRKCRTDFLTYRKTINLTAKWGWWQIEIAQELQQFYDDLVAGKRPKLVIQAPPQHGKLIADYVPVLTTSGWKSHGDLRVGDCVYHPSGRPVRIIAVSPKAPADMRVTLSTGESLHCHERHEWTVYLRDRGRYETLETGAMAAGRMHTGTAGKRGSRYTYQLPGVEPLAGVYKANPRRRVAIRSIDHDPQGHIGHCIQVDSPDGLYLVGRTMQPTHNSVQIIDFISWIAGRNPNCRTIYTSFSDRLGIRANLRLQRLYDSEIYAEIFPETTINRSNAVTLSGQYLRNREILEYVGKEGFFRNTTVRGSITGESLDLGVIDDPIRGRQDANSPTIRDAAWDWFTDDFFTRFSEEAGLLAILTRWHVDDPIGRLIDRYPEVKVLSYPAIAEVNDEHRKVGDALFPEHKSVEFLRERESIMDRPNWLALYQQRPTASMDGTLFSVEKMLVDGAPVQVPNGCDYVFAIMDSAFKAGDKNDGTAVTYFARNRFIGHPLIILDWEIVQIEGDLIANWFPSITARLEELARDSGARMGSAGCFVEDKASGILLLQHAARNGWAAHPIDSKLTAMGKDARGVAVSGYVYQGHVKMSDLAYNKTLKYKGRTQNHFMTQVFGYQLGVPNQSDDLFDTATYGIAIALGDGDGL